jgi:hypothetical protein
MKWRVFVGWCMVMRLGCDVEDCGAIGDGYFGK